jgi:4-hydroxy-tetrahydrodipicolinate synthase
MTTMSKQILGGVIAAVPTPFTAAFEPDTERYLRLCAWLLANGCDGLNLCGTTGEATSMSVRQRAGLMRAAAERLPTSRLLVGTGASSLADAVELTCLAADLGFAGALVLPPFFYPGVTEEGIVDYFAALVEATRQRPIGLYLYNIPANTGITFSLSLIEKLRTSFGERIRGLKDSSGNMDYARSVAQLPFAFDVFPSSEAVLIEARTGLFAGCISASVNVNSAYCARAWREGDLKAADIANRIRAAVSRRNLVASVKAVTAMMHDDSALEPVLPPLRMLAATDRIDLMNEFNSIIGSGT